MATANPILKPPKPLLAQQAEQNTAGFTDLLNKPAAPTAVNYTPKGGLIADAANNTAQTESPDSAPGFMVNNRAEPDQQPLAPPPITTGPTADPNAPSGAGANPLTRPSGTSPNSSGSGVQTTPASNDPRAARNAEVQRRATAIGNGAPSTGATSAPPPTIGNDPNGTGYYPGGVVPTGVTGQGATNGTPAAPTTAEGQNAWDPKTGLVGEISKAATKDVTSIGYKTGEVGAAKGYEAGGYDPTTYDAVQSKENLSDAINRITGKDSELLQREEAMASAAANSRGMLNSSMAVQAGRAAVLDKATQIGQGDVQNAQFNASEANQALRFSAQAKNDSAAFLANATNRAAEFGAGEANKVMMFAVEQYNMAERFSAEMENAARSQNAEAYNRAEQAYQNALNAARGAEYDAENLARRDTAAFAQQSKEGAADRENRIATASIGANASVQAANINAQSRAAEGAADREFQRSEGQANREARRYEYDTNTRMGVDQMGQSAFNQYQSGLNSIMQADMEPEARQNALHNYNSVWAGNPYLPIKINMASYPPYTPPANP